MYGYYQDSDVYDLYYIERRQPRIEVKSCFVLGLQYIQRYALKI